MNTINLFRATVAWLVFEVLNASVFAAETPAVPRWQPHDFSFTTTARMANPFMVSISATINGPDGKTFTPDPADMPAGSDVDTNFIRTIQGTETIAAAPINGLRTI